MRNLLKKADLLVSPYEFNVNQRQKSLTVVGGILTVLVGLFSIFYMFGAIQKTLQDQKIIYVGTMNTNTNNYDINNLNTNFALAISDDKGNYYENFTDIQELIEIKIQYIQLKRTTENSNTEKISNILKLKKCETESQNFFNFDAISITSSDNKNLFCTDDPFTLKGSYFDLNFSYLKIEILTCQNQTQNKCQSSEQIQEFINNGINLDLFIQGFKLKNELNLASPIENNPKNIYWKLSNRLANYEDIFIQPFQMDLKYNQIFYNLMNYQEERNVFQKSQFEKSERRLDQVNSKGSLCTFYMRSSQTSSYYFLTQSDFFSILSSSLSETTALAVALMSFFKIFYHSYNQHKTFAVLMNSVFKFDLESVKRKRQSSMHQNDQSGNIFQQKIQTSLKSKDQLQQILNFEITYSFFQYLKFLISKMLKYFNKKNIINTEKEIVISQIAKSKIQYDLDLTNILKKLYEIDCLKLFFFDDDQLVLFNTFCSPVFQDSMINQKDLFDLLINQQQQKLINSQLQEKEKKFDLTFVACSEIPINVRLARIARFFKAQLGATNSEQLVKTFQIISKNENQNSAMNSRLLDFVKQNQSLYRLVQAQCESLQKQQQNLQVPDEMIESLRKSSVDGKESSLEVQSLQIVSDKQKSYQDIQQQD